MSLSHQLDGGILRFTTTGDVDYRSGLAALSGGFACASACPHPGGWHLLFDIRASTENRTPDELRTIATVITSHRSILSGRCAVVATDPLHYGLARMFGVFTEGLGFEVAVFERAEDPLAWFAGPGV